MKLDMVYAMKIWLLVTLFVAMPAALSARSDYIEVNAPVNRQLKLAVETILSPDASSPPDTVINSAEVIANDMNMSGVVLAEIRLQQSSSGSELFADVYYTPWLNAGFDMLVRSELSLQGDRLVAEFRLFDVINRKMITAKRYLGVAKDLRRFSHSFADEILRALTGEKGVFTTKIAYVSTQTGNKEIYVMDWDGNNPLPLTKNGSINLNPDFSPDGREIIFTSYKRRNPDLYRRALSSPVEVL